LAKTPNSDTPRRFYREVGVNKADGGFQVTLDGRAPKTPVGLALTLPTKALAKLVAAEWKAQAAAVDLGAMPATRLAFTTIDRAAGARAAFAAEVARFAASDVICYFADSPPALVERQTKFWIPLLDWAGEALGVRLERASGITHRAQSPEALARAESLSAGLGDFALTGLAHAAGLFGSAVLAFALQRGRLSGDEAFDLSRLDEAFQEERWGVDAEAAARAAAMRAQAQLLERWFKALA
jgi:chaperone required for assembly of F1-ATPase